MNAPTKPRVRRPWRSSFTSIAGSQVGKSGGAIVVRAGAGTGAGAGTERVLIEMPSREKVFLRISFQDGRFAQHRDEGFFQAALFAVKIRHDDPIGDEAPQFRGESGGFGVRELRPHAR